MMKMNNMFNLDWWANSEHGGGFAKNGLVSGINADAPSAVTYWDSYTPNPIIGTVDGTPHQNMWRWQSLRDSSFAGILKARATYPTKLIIQSYEMNVPGHEHGSMGLITNQFSLNPNVNPLAQFEFTFDANDKDINGGVAQGWTKSTLSNSHAKTIAALKWLNANYPTTSYLVPAHPERKPKSSGYTIAAFRDMNNAAPSVCFGFESMPGHQKASGRGGYSKTAQGGGTFGGAGYFSAKVGGLWDAMLSEGRNWWLFANSDCHIADEDFFPGEYQKNYTYVADKTSAQAVIDGLRSGNTWVVTGDLIDSLDYSIASANVPSNVAVMGQKLTLNDSKVTLHIKVRDPQSANNNTYSSYTNPELNHIDIISGIVGDTISSTSANYNVDSVATTKVIARFAATAGETDSKGITTQAWTDLGNGWKEISYTFNVNSNSYYRLRGTNLGLNVTNETDAAGNPLPDSLMLSNNAEKAFNDLWFYSNPIFVKADTIITKAAALVASDYTVPSWTKFSKVLTTAKESGTTESLTNLYNAISELVSKDQPYNINMTFNGNPSSRMGFAWFTNTGVKDEQIRVIAGNATDTLAFANPLFTVKATADSVNLNYCVSGNNLLSLAGIANNTKANYISNKALVSGLTANTTYSYIVGKPGAWSKVGSFTTAKDSKDAFSFIYFTDPQANNDNMFNISQKTTHAAVHKYPDANFILSCGDLVETSGSTNSEWEYEQFFETQQDIWYNKPLVPVTGNHDKSKNKNFSKHFNTNSVSFDQDSATTPGSVYSFVYGNALFMALNFEDYGKTGYLDSLSSWMKKEVAAHPEVRWRIAFYHKTMYTGSKSHQSDNDSKIVREKMGPLFDSLKIDFALQGHDHIYEVMGPIKGNKLVSNAITNQVTVPRTVRDNVTGKLGGTFDVTNGTLYFLNNSAGKKKYEPRDSVAMKTAESTLNITDYFTFFTGRFGQTGEPTFSNITVSSDSINISTYTVNDAGEASIFDSYKIVKTIHVDTVIVSNKSLSLIKGSSALLSATVNPSLADNKNVTWKSTDETIATVVDGTVTARKVGTVSIVVSSVDGSKSDTCKVTVTPLAVTNVTVSNKTISIVRKNSATITATINPIEADNQTISWKSTDESIATVSNGVISALKTGSVSIVAITNDGGYSDTCKVKVTPIVVTGVTVSDKTLSIIKGSTGTITATVNPSDADNKNVTWKSTDESVATVANGTISTLKTGTVSIVVTSEDGNYTDTCLVSVAPAVGLNTEKLQHSISVAPNPVKNITRIQSKAIILNVNVLAISGQVLFSQKANSNMVDVDMSGFAKGSYLLVIQTEEGTITKHLIKQ
jgi:uncharacterized protein YjdB